MRPRELILIPILFAMLSGCAAPERTASNADNTFLQQPGNWIDLSHEFSFDTIYWPTANGFEHTVDFKGMTSKGYFYASYEYKASEHGGTHLDAPIHFAKLGAIAIPRPSTGQLTPRLGSPASRDGRLPILPGRPSQSPQSTSGGTAP